jgi:hypothetical protein
MSWLKNLFKVNLLKVAAKLVRDITMLDGKPGLSKADIETVIGWVIKAENDTTLGSGAEKGRWVKQQVLKFLKISAPYLVELVVSIAVGIAARNGWIHLSKIK